MPSSPSEPLVTGIRFREGGFRVAQQQSYHKVDKSRVNLVFQFDKKIYYPARARSARARRACALRALGLLLADGTPTGGRGEDFLSRQPDFFTETAVTPERKVEKSFPRWEINRHVEG